jgi:hypothetical protein
MGATIECCYGNGHLPNSKTHSAEIRIINYECRDDKKTMLAFGCDSYEHPLIPDRCFECGEEIIAIVRTSLIEKLAKKLDEMSVYYLDDDSDGEMPLKKADEISIMLASENAPLDKAIIATGSYSKEQAKSGNSPKVGEHSGSNSASENAKMTLPREMTDKESKRMLKNLKPLEKLLKKMEKEETTPEKLKRTFSWEEKGKLRKPEKRMIYYEEVLASKFNAKKTRKAIERAIKAHRAKKVK